MILLSSLRSRLKLDRNRPLQIEPCPAGENDAVAFDGADDRAATRRDLAGGNPRLAEPAAPIGHDGSMRRAGHRILIDPERRRKIARHAINAVASRRTDDDTLYRGDGRAPQNRASK